ncbi:MAG: hypothetical protein ACT4OZ_05230 [Gemmatimonadota bacterium]
MSAVLLSLIALAEAPAQELPQAVAVGTRVRVFAPSIRRDRYVGRIDSLSQAEVVLDTAKARRRLGFEMGPVLVESFRRVRLQTRAVEVIEVSGGRTTRRSTVKGMIIGGLIGGALIGFGQAPEVNPTLSDYAKGFPIGAAAGLVVGGAVGYALGGEKWLPGRWPQSP